MTSVDRWPRKQKDALDYLNSDEVAYLKRYGVTVSKTFLKFSEDLEEPELRHLWHLVSAIARRRPKSEDWVNWLIGDWANKVSRRLGEPASYRIIKQEEQAYNFTQHLLRLAGATLMSLQLAEFAMAICCRLLDPEGGRKMTARVLSPETVSRRRTLGQLNKQISKRKIFVSDFEQRMDGFVKRRNRFAHHMLVENLHVVQLEHTARTKGLKKLESFLLALLLEAHGIGSVFFGLITAIGVTAAERENVKNLELFLGEHGAAGWRENLQKFGDVQRRA